MSLGTGIFTRAKNAISHACSYEGRMANLHNKLSAASSAMYRNNYKSATPFNDARPDIAKMNSIRSKIDALEKHTINQSIKNGSLPFPGGKGRYERQANMAANKILNPGSRTLF